ncbi:hypothetical protein MNV49_001869 [Pseudohyphozyma bogoriensis]|nr:hypothetical protein MNV49_001869 [Pseudohyphozyma bogoriensis]
MWSKKKAKKDEPITVVAKPRVVTLPPPPSFESVIPPAWQTQENERGLAFAELAISDDIRLRIIVVGSGFAGLSTAIACARQGFAVTLLERSTGLSPHGDAITLGCNAAKILRRWGLAKELWERSAKGAWWLFKDSSGAEISAEDLRKYPEKFGAPLLQGHRAQFLGSLGIEARLLGVKVLYERDVYQYRDTPRKPAIVTKQGDVIYADTILICDGTSSRSRDLLIPRGHRPAVELSDYSIFRSAQSSDQIMADPQICHLLDGCTRTWIGPYAHATITPLDNGNQVAFSFTHRAAAGQSSLNWKDRKNTADVVLPCLDGWDPVLVRAIKYFPSTLNWKLPDEPPAARWISEGGCICFLGDAVHAMVPTSFQGGSTAVEDAATVALCLALAGGGKMDVRLALQVYESLRKPICDEVFDVGLEQQRKWHAFFSTRRQDDVKLLTGKAYMRDAELFCLANFEAAAVRVNPDFAFSNDVFDKILRTSGLDGKQPEWNPFVESAEIDPGKPRRFQDKGDQANVDEWEYVLKKTRPKHGHAAREAEGLRTELNACAAPLWPREAQGFLVPMTSTPYIKYIEENEQKWIDRLAEAVAIPSVSGDPKLRPEVHRMGKWLQDQLTSLGVSVKSVPLGPQDIDGVTVELPPVLLGELGNDPAKKTICIYGHYDVQPALKSDGWEHEPFVLTDDKASGRLYGRGSSDDKGPILGWLNVIEAHQQTNTPLPVNLKMIFEGMEESGSNGLDELVIKESKGFLSSVDAVCISDNYWLGTTSPCVTYGLRGLSYFKVSVSGPGADLHSGVFGGMVHEPMTDLFALFSKLVTPDGKILIPGINDDVAVLTDEERARYDVIDVTVQDFESAVGAKVTISEDKTECLMARMRYPSLSIHGVEGAFSGAGAKTVIPAAVHGKFSIRLVPDLTPEGVDALVQPYLKAEFAKLKSKNTLKVEMISGGRPWVADINHWNYAAATKATETIYGKTPDFTREGGSIPITLTLSEALGVNVLLLPMGRGDDGAHSINEKLDRSNYLEGSKLLGTYLHECAAQA